MEMCLGDQQFMTLQFYLNDIHVFATCIDQMFNQIEMVFSWLKEIYLKIKPYQCHFFWCSMVFLSYMLSVDGVSANPKK